MDINTEYLIRTIRADLKKEFDNLNKSVAKSNKALIDLKDSLKLIDLDYKE